MDVVADMYCLMKWLLESPYPKIDIHTAAIQIFDLLCRRGFEFPDDLARAVVRHEDERAFLHIDQKIADLEKFSG